MTNYFRVDAASLLLAVMFHHSLGIAHIQHFEGVNVRIS